LRTGGAALRRDSRSGPPLKRAHALLLLLLFSQALIGPLLTNETDPDGGEALRLIWPPVYLVALVLIALNPAPVMRVMMRSWPLVLLAALTLIFGGLVDRSGHHDAPRSGCGDDLSVRPLAGGALFLAGSDPP
jgi:hypothetical protein